jgi:serine/threonine-protein kinase RsbW
MTSVDELFWSAPPEAPPPDALPPGSPPEPHAPGSWSLLPLRVPARLSRLDHVAGYVREVASRAGIGRAAGYRLRLAVEELAVNTIVHGYAGRVGELVLTGGGDRSGGSRTQAWIVIEDTAAPYDPGRPRAAPPVHLPPAERPIGGLGVHLALTAADSYAYDYRCGVNRSTVRVHRRPGEEA